MLRNKVVLVLGAGASNPYGFPLGGKIVRDILKGQITPQWTQMIQQVGFNYSDFQSLQRDLLYARMPSIDAFLEVRREYEVLGKALIALYIADKENEGLLYKVKEDGEEDQDWYQYLFNLVIRESDIREFTTKKLSFITYNYDRSLEFFLYNAMRQQLRIKNDDGAYEVFKQIDIVHLHGKIGELAVDKIGVGAGRAYKQIESESELNTARAGIKIIYEDVAKDPVFEKALQLMKEAQVLIFLGFSYHPTNVSRLRMKEVFSIPPKTIVGTAKGMTESEIAMQVVPQFNFPGVSMGVALHQFPTITALQFLRNNLHLF